MVAPQPLTDPWQHCLNRLGGDIPQQQFNTWIRPLQAEWQESGLVLAAPNRFIRDFVAEKYLPMISRYLLDVVPPAAAHASVTVAGAPAGRSFISTIGSSGRPHATVEPGTSGYGNGCGNGGCAPPRSRRPGVAI